MFYELGVPLAQLELEFGIKKARICALADQARRQARVRLELMRQRRHGVAVSVYERKIYEMQSQARRNRMAL